MNPAGDPATRALDAAAALHHAYFTALIIGLVGRKSADLAEDFVFRVFRRQHLELFLPGLRKLGLEGLPPAVACARYHATSNAIGGVRTEFIPETDRKAWLRYPPPRWIWAGTAVAAVPSRVSAAMLRGWHAHNGVSLGNPRLGFVCTGQTVDGHFGLEGYYLEYDRPLAEEERLRFAPGETPPQYDPAQAPRLAEADWPPERLAKANRNYATAYIRNALPVLLELLGREEGIAFGRLIGRLIGMQFYPDLAAPLGAKTVDGFLDLVIPASGTPHDHVPDRRAAWEGLWEGCRAHSRVR